MKLQLKMAILLVSTFPLTAGDLSLFGKLFGQSISIVVGYLFCNDLVGITQSIKQLSVTNIPEAEFAQLESDITALKKQKTQLENALNVYIKEIQVVDEDIEKIDPSTKKGKQEFTELQKKRSEHLKKLEQNRAMYERTAQLMKQRKGMRDELIKHSMQAQGKILEGAFEGYIKTMHSIKAQEYSQPGKHS